MMPRVAGLSLLFLPPLVLLGACRGNDADQMPDGIRNRPVTESSGRVAKSPANPASATPMAERVAVIGLLNKRNGLTRDLTMKPGQALRVGDAIVRLRACETTAPWESMPDTGAFVQLDVRSAKDGKWRRNFSGWLFRERPDRNVVQHPIYDVWVKSCAMSWPEVGPDTVKLSDTKSGGKSVADPKASAAQAPAPEENSSPASPSGTSATAAPSNDR